MPNIFAAVEINQIERDFMQQVQGQIKDHKVADPYHPIPRNADVAAVEVGKTVEHEKQHRGQLKQREYSAPTRSKGFGQQCHHGHDGADPAQEEHDIQLMIADKTYKAHNNQTPGSADEKLLTQELPCDFNLEQLYVLLKSIVLFQFTTKCETIKWCSTLSLVLLDRCGSIYIR